MEPKRYLAIDLKSFYASVECMERGLNPMTTNLVVGGFVPHRKDHLPGGDALPQSLRHLRPGPAVRGGPAGEAGQ